MTELRLPVKVHADASATEQVRFLYFKHSLVSGLLPFI